MLSRRSLCIGLLLFPVLPAYGQKTSPSHTRARPHVPRAHARRTNVSRATASVTSPKVYAVSLSVEGADSDSLQTIISRDLQFGDRVQIVSAEQTPAPSAIVKAVATAQGVSVSLIDPLSGAVRQQRDFALPIVAPRRDQAIADSLNQAFTARDLLDRTSMVRAETVRDSLQLELAKKPPRLRNNKAKSEYAALVARRDTMLRDAVAEIALVQDARARDEASRAGVQAAAVAHGVAVFDSTTQARRWAIHGVSDAVEEWVSGHRGIAQSRVAYVSNGLVRVVDFDGANDHAVTGIDKNGDKAMSPAWRPDDNAIVYSEMSDAGTQIAIVDLRTGISKPLDATPRGLNITPVFSADGKWVIYGNSDNFHTSLVQVRPDSVASLRRLPLNRLFDEDEPVLSPDGTRIAYVSARPRTPQIYSSNLDGSDEQVEAPAPPNTRVYHTSPDWSPDGRMIAYQQQNGDFQVWVVNRADHVMRKLTKTGENEDPSWAPDSRHMALTSSRGGAKAIWVLDAESGRFRQLTAAGDARLAAWSGRIGATPPAPHP